MSGISRSLNSLISGTPGAVRGKLADQPDEIASAAAVLGFLQLPRPFEQFSALRPSARPSTAAASPQSARAGAPAASRGSTGRPGFSIARTSATVFPAERIPSYAFLSVAGEIRFVQRFDQFERFGAPVLHQFIKRGIAGRNTAVPPIPAHPSQKNAGRFRRRSAFSRRTRAQNAVDRRNVSGFQFAQPDGIVRKQFRQSATSCLPRPFP